MALGRGEMLKEDEEEEEEEEEKVHRINLHSGDLVPTADLEAVGAAVTKKRV